MSGFTTPPSSPRPLVCPGAPKGRTGFAGFTVPPMQLGDFGSHASPLRQEPLRSKNPLPPRVAQKPRAGSPMREEVPLRSEKTLPPRVAQKRRAGSPLHQVPLRSKGPCPGAPMKKY